MTELVLSWVFVGRVGLVMAQATPSAEITPTQLPEPTIEVTPSPIPTPIPTEFPSPTTKPSPLPTTTPSTSPAPTASVSAVVTSDNSPDSGGGRGGAPVVEEKPIETPIVVPKVIPPAVTLTRPDPIGPQKSPALVLPQQSTLDIPGVVTTVGTQLSQNFYHSSQLPPQQTKQLLSIAGLFIFSGLMLTSKPVTFFNRLGIWP